MNDNVNGVGDGPGAVYPREAPVRGMEDAMVQMAISLGACVVGVKKELKSGGRKQAWLWQKNTEECGFPSQARERFKSDGRSGSLPTPGQTSPGRR